MLKNKFKEYMEKQLEVKETKTEFKAKVIKYVDLVFLDENVFNVINYKTEDLPKTLTQLFLKMFENEINKKLTYDNVFEIVKNHCDKLQTKKYKVSF